MILIQLDTRINEILESIPFCDEIVKDRLLDELAFLNECVEMLESNTFVYQ